MEPAFQWHRIHFCDAIGKQVPLTWKDPMKQSADQKERPKHHRSDGGREKGAQFFFVKGNHECGSKLGSPEHGMTLGMRRGSKKCLCGGPHLGKQIAFAVGIEVCL